MLLDIFNQYFSLMLFLDASKNEAFSLDDTTQYIEHHGGMNIFNED